MEIVEVIKPKENEPISKLKIFEVENLDLFNENSLNNEEEEKEINYSKQEENESKNKPGNKTPLETLN